jgi:hypothetical protein
MQINGLLLQNILLITSSQLEFLVRNSRDGTHLGIGLFGWEKKYAQKVRSLLCEFCSDALAQLTRSTVVDASIDTGILLSRSLICGHD